MAGILEEYGLDLADMEVPSFDINDGEYDWEIGDVFIREGSQKHPDKSWLIIEYLLDNGKKYGELFGLPEDASAPTDGEKSALGRYKGRLLSLGFDESQVNSVGRDELVGIQGHFTLLTARGFQNVRNLTLPDDGQNQFADAAKEGPGNPAQTFVGKAEAAPAAKAPAARRAPAAPKAAPAAAPTAVDNPFA